MNAMAIGLLLTLLAGQAPGASHGPGMPGVAGAPAVPGGQVPGQEQAPAVPRLHAVAAHAFNEGNSPVKVDEALEGVKKTLLSLPFDTFEPVADQEVETPLGEETLIPLNGIYSLYVAPRGQDEKGALDLTARISMLAEGSGSEQYIDAIHTEAKLASGMPLVFRGLDLNVGELVVVLSLSGDDKQQGQSQSNDAKEQEKSQDDKQEDKQASNENKNQNQERQEQQEQQDNPSSAQDQKDTPDLRNIEALLQSLEEMDRKEQEDQQHIRTGIRVRGDWW